MSTSAPQEQPPGQDQPAAAPPPAPPVGDGPWANDLNALFEDPAVRSQVDQFLRTKVQPHTTKLEQQIAGSKEAVQLWEQFSEDPQATYVGITEALYGQEAAQQLLATLTPQEQQQVAQQVQQDPRIAEMMQFYEQQQAGQQYDAELARVTAENPDVDAEGIHYFVAAAEGDFDKAVGLYRDFTAKFGAPQQAMDAAAMEQALAPQAPPALGSDTNTAAPGGTPMEPKKQTLDEALNDFMGDLRANREAPPVVG